MLLEITKILIVLLPMLLSVAFLTLVERKLLASMQNRLGPNLIGFYGVMQPFADALKLLSKENVSPRSVNRVLFSFSPLLSLVFSILP